MSTNRQPVCLTIAGLDPSGGAGVLADIKTFSAFGCFGAAAVTSLTFQNTTGVFGVENVSAETLRRQLEPVFDDYDVAAVKTGMLPTRENIETVAVMIKERGVQNFVLDPVIRSTSGHDLIDDDALDALCALLFPLATVVTPNLPEAERITGLKIEGLEDIGRAADAMRAMGARSVLIKGGHATGPRAIDTLYAGNGIEHFEADRVETTSTQGTGCTLSAAIAANLALRHDLPGSVRRAKEYVTEAIRTAPGIGRGHGPVNHLVRPG